MLEMINSSLLDFPPLISNSLNYQSGEGEKGPYTGAGKSSGTEKEKLILIRASNKGEEINLEGQKAKALIGTYPSLVEGEIGQDSLNGTNSSFVEGENGQVIVSGLIPDGKNSWRSLFSAPKLVTAQTNWKFSPPQLVEGKKVVVSKSSNTTGTHWCEKLVIGFFIGKSLSFSAVKVAVEKLWKLKKEVSIRAYGNGAFIFEFSDDEDRTKILEMGAFYISSKLFSLRPWTPLVEKSVTDIKLIPVWVCIYGVPLHLWDVEGLGLIASYLGKPLLADECTINKSRLAFARICIEIEIDFEYPDHIPLVVDDITFDLPVEYQWKPQKCDNCRVFGHETKHCSRLMKAKWVPKARVILVGTEKGADSENVPAVESGSARVELQTNDSNVNNSATTLEVCPAVVTSRKDIVEVRGIPGYTDTLGGKSVGIQEVSRNEGTGKGEKTAVGTGNNAGTSKAAVEAYKENMRIGQKKVISTENAAELEGEWNVVRGRKQVSEVKKPFQSPKKNPFLMLSDFKSESRFPINRKKEAKDCVAREETVGLGASGLGAAVQGLSEKRAAETGTGVAGVTVNRVGVSVNRVAGTEVNGASVSGAILKAIMPTSGEAKGTVQVSPNQNLTGRFEEDWKTMKGKSQLRTSPQRNPFMVLSDFKAESRFPINRKLEDEEFERKFKNLSEDQKKLKKQEREMKRLMWNAQPGKGDGASPGGGTRSQQKKK